MRIAGRVMEKDAACKPCMKIQSQFFSRQGQGLHTPKVPDETRRVTRLT